MSLKRHGRAVLDIAMGCLLLFLLSYPLTRGLYRHGVAGAALLTLFVLHHLVNLSWHKTIFKGRYTLRRSLAACVEFMLLAATVAVMISSLCLSGEVFSYLMFPMTGQARALHNCSTAWLFLLAAAHLGLHWRWLWKKGARLLGKYWIFAATLVFFNGIFCCIKSGLWLTLLADATFLSETFSQFILQYLGMALGVYMLPQIIFHFIKKNG